MTSRPWWRDAVTYEIYIRSFADSDGNGIGDLPGITSRLPYLADLGVDAIWITPFYPSPMVDHGYDVADYDAVDPVFGQLHDFEALVARAHELGIRVLIDLVPNHTSDQHRWFRQALTDPSSPERGYYVFRDPAPDGGPPNDWQAHFGGPAWTLDPASGQYYLHCFAPEQPDLNWFDEHLSGSFDQILRFWLDRGVDGFRVDVANGLCKDVDATEPPKHPGKTTITIPGWNQPAARKIFERWNTLLREYGDDRVLVGEVGTVDTQQLVQYVGPDALQQSFNFPFIELPFDAAAYRTTISEQLVAFNAIGETCTWVLGNHDQVRVATRYGGGDFGRRRARAAFTFVAALPGSLYLYQGEELGLEEVPIPEHLRQDPFFFRTKGAHPGRDGCRTPMPWTPDAPGHGFTDADTTWLPFALDATTRNVATMEGSISLFRDVIALRHERMRDRSETITWLETPADTIAFARDGIVAVLNTSDDAVAITIPGAEAILIANGPDGTLDGEHLTLPGATAAWVQTRR